MSAEQITAIGDVIAKIGITAIGFLVLAYLLVRLIPITLKQSVTITNLTEQQKILVAVQSTTAESLKLASENQATLIRLDNDRVARIQELHDQLTTGIIDRRKESAVMLTAINDISPTIEAAIDKSADGAKTESNRQHIITQGLIGKVQVSLEDKLQSMQDRFVEKLDKMMELITELRADVKSNNRVTVEQLESIVSKVADMTTQIKQLDVALRLPDAPKPSGSATITIAGSETP